MMSGHRANPIFFDKKKKKIERQEHLLTPPPPPNPQPPTSENISFLPFHSYVYHPLHKIQFNLHVPRIVEIGFNDVKIWKGNWRVLIHLVF